MINCRPPTSNSQAFFTNHSPPTTNEVACGGIHVLVEARVCGFQVTSARSPSARVMALIHHTMLVSCVVRETVERQSRKVAASVDPYRGRAVDIARLPSRDHVDTRPRYAGNARGTDHGDKNQQDDRDGWRWTSRRVCSGSQEGTGGVSGDAGTAVDGGAGGAFVEFRFGAVQRCSYRAGGVAISRSLTQRSVFARLSSPSVAVEFEAALQALDTALDLGQVVRFAAPRARGLFRVLVRLAL